MSWIDLYAGSSIEGKKIILRQMFLYNGCHVIWDAVPVDRLMALTL